MDRALRAAVVGASGVLLWTVAAMGTRTAEPWDSPAFWYAYLVAIVVSGIWGYLFPQRPWLWGVIMSFAQAPVMWATSGEIGSMWLPGLVALGVLAVPLAGAAAVASRFSALREA
jgi:hypothetical protein